MAVAPSLLYRGTLTNTNATLKTTDAVATTVVTSIIATNKTASAATFTISVNGFYFAYQMPIAAYQTVTIDVKQVTGTNINIQGLASANSTVDVSISGVVSTGPADQAWTAYTPTLTASTTNPTNWTQTGYYTTFGKTVFVKFRLTATASVTAGSGTYRIALPLAASTSLGGDVEVGDINMYDSSAGSQIIGSVYISSSTPTIALFSYPTSLTALGVVTNAAPYTWASGDTIRGTFTYEAA
jgi:hypothetical protein